MGPEEWLEARSGSRASFEEVDERYRIDQERRVGRQLCDV
jgi:hypothetical protein